MARPIDHAEIKTGQLITIAMAATATVLQDPRIVVTLAALFLVTAMYRPMSPFVLAYRLVVRPLGLMRSDYRLDNTQPHTFGQYVGAITALLAAGLVYVGLGVTGWAIVWILLGLTFASYRGWCIGCYLYYQLNRVGLGGFFRHKPTDRTRILGTRPETRVSPED